MSLFHHAPAACLLAIFFAAQPSLADRAAAHHTYVTKYNPDKIVSLKGTISSVDYRNPHIFFEITVTSRDGSTTTWRVETEAIAKAQAKDLSESKLQVGTAVVVTGWMSRTGEAEIGLKSISIGAKTYTIRNTAR
ncbi:MAG: hypothetical protein APF80_14655 [Alphaproteobacteria bacterium BRH_c36]|nr:MAG: hypothetical protein APF80_14655 [Alphaproteobacteria bacterium BRH_c36]